MAALNVSYICFLLRVFQAMLQTSGQLELEVRPLFLVPDTNGFIDHLEGLKKLLQCGIYIIVVPLIGKKNKNKELNVGMIKFRKRKCLLMFEYNKMCFLFLFQ